MIYFRRPCLAIAIEKLSLLTSQRSSALYFSNLPTPNYTGMQNCLRFCCLVDLARNTTLNSRKMLASVNTLANIFLEFKVVLRAKSSPKKICLIDHKFTYTNCNIGGSDICYNIRIIYAMPQIGYTI